MPAVFTEFYAIKEFTIKKILILCTLRKNAASYCMPLIERPVPI